MRSPSQAHLAMDFGMLGVRKSSGVLERYLRDVTCRNARAADEGVEAVSCEQLRYTVRVAMIVDYCAMLYE